ncbi:VOC family protein [Microlunatus parietis]|uniref:Putative enzyme related to lactoylglutathione lyase n=1 Tax=Microlunatus parietis TaxID=682979 RepID=A0A7Y9LB58_9ACTN|nr:hypothetical protein [Microlunatus parietis]NYE69481.1 putative enzyme related to lactoylglutathione lyase [Microlunatus parietis]
MSELTTKQPAGTPTWIDLGIPDLDRAMTFYGAFFGWEFDVGPRRAAWPVTTQDPLDDQDRSALPTPPAAG